MFTASPLPLHSVSSLPLHWSSSLSLFAVSLHCLFSLSLHCYVFNTKRKRKKEKEMGATCQEAGGEIHEGVCRMADQ